MEAEAARPGWLLESVSPMPLEDERQAAALLAYAHQQAARWGAGRFALELRRRDEEERRQRAAETWSPGPRVDTPEDDPLAVATQGPVLADVSEQVVGSARIDLDLQRPMRHPEVPRPPAPEPELEAPRRRRRRHDPATPEVSAILAQQAPHMSPGARRLYGIPDPANRRGL